MLECNASNSVKNQFSASSPPRIEKYVFGSNSAEKFALNSRLQQMARLFLNLSNLQ